MALKHITFSMLTSLLSILVLVTVESRFVDDPTCLEAGVFGYNLCYIGAFSLKVDKPCCGTKTWCLSSTDTSVKDKFCMKYDIEVGEPCGSTAEFNYIGYCGAGSNCIDGICVDAASSTTTTPSTTTPTTTCDAGGTKCYENGQFIDGVDCCTGFACEPYDDPIGYCLPASSSTCASGGTQCLQNGISYRCCNGFSCIPAILAGGDPAGYCVSDSTEGSGNGTTCAAGGSQCFQNGQFIDGVACCAGFVCLPISATDGYCMVAP